MKVLILEDNLKALSFLMEAFKELEPEIGSFDITCFSEALVLEDFLESINPERFDLVLLDKLSRDKKTFHEVIFDKIDSSKMIAISNTDSYNQEAIERGVLREVRKDYLDLNQFKVKIKKEIKDFV